MPFFLAMVRLVLGLGLGLGLGLRRRPGVIKVRVGMPLFPYMIVRQWIGNGISGDRWGAAARAHQKHQLPRAARARPEVEAGTWLGHCRGGHSNHAAPLLIQDLDTQVIGRRRLTLRQPRSDAGRMPLAGQLGGPDLVSADVPDCSYWAAYHT